MAQKLENQGEAKEEDDETEQPARKKGAVSVVSLQYIYIYIYILLSVRLLISFHDPYNM